MGRICASESIGRLATRQYTTNMFLTLFCNYPTPLCTLVEDFKISYMYRYTKKEAVKIYKILLLTNDFSLSRHKRRLIKGLISTQNSWLTFSCSMTVKTLDIDCIINRFRKEAL